MYSSNLSDQKWSEIEQFFARSDPRVHIPAHFDH